MTFSLVYILLFAVVNVYGLGKTILDGDVYIQFIGAIYSNSSCNNIKAETVQNIQAIKWTLSKLNDADYVPNLNIGLRISQTCKKRGEPEKIALQIATEMYNNSGKDVRIIGVIGSDYSFETESISRLLSSLPEENRLLQGAFSATSASLRDRNVYKNFFRTIPPDDIQVEVMIEFMEALNWTYMAIIYDDDSYGKGGKDELLLQSKGLDVCFPVRIHVDTTYNNEVKFNLEEDIKYKIIGADVPISGVLVFGSSFLADLVLIVTEKVVKNNKNVVHPVFLFSEAGGYIQGRHENISKGAFVLSPPKRVISSFQEHWTQIFTDTSKLYQEIESNSLIREVYTEIFNCTPADTKENNTCRQLTKPEFVEMVPVSVYNQYAIQTTLVFAKVVKNIFERACPNKEICARFRDTKQTPRYDFVKELSSITEINFDNFGISREIKEFRDPDLVVNFGESSEINLLGDFPIYEVYSHQICQEEEERTCMIKVAGYKKSKELNVISSDIKDYNITGYELLWPNIRKAQCPDGKFCPKCHTDLSEESILFIPGDMYIIGVAPIHTKGSTPLKCGEIKKGGLDIAETIRFAVKEAKSKPEANIGIVIIDSCNDPQIIQEKILTLHRFGVYVKDRYIPIGDKILGYIGGWSSDVSKAVADIISRLKYPQISYASTAPILSDRSIYPYFLRTPIPDDKQAETILKIVERLQGNYIQIVHSEGAYGEGGRDLLTDYIKKGKFDMCVAQTISFKTDTNGSDVLNKLRKFSKAHIVVLFLGSFDVVQLFKIFNMIDRNEFLFISSEGWGTRFNVSLYGNLNGCITVTSQLNVNEKLKDHFASLKPDRSNINQWIRPYMEKEFDCYFEWSYDKRSRKKCKENVSLNVFTHDFRLDAWSPFVERGVIALLSSAETALREKCDGNTTELCDAYKDRPKYMYEAVKKVKIQGGNSFKTRIFNDNGDGIAGLQVYVVNLEENGQYKEIGDSSVGTEDGGLDLTFQLDTFYKIRGAHVKSTCSDNIENCKKCFPRTSEKSGPSAGIMALLILLGVTCFVLLAVLVFVCCRVGFCLKIDDGQFRFNDTYITPMYMRGRKRNQPHEEAYDDLPGSPTGSPMSCIPDGSTSSSERIQQSRVVKDDGQLRFNNTYITPIRNRPHEEAYDDPPGSPTSLAMSCIPDGSTSSSERKQQSRPVGNSSQNTLGTDNDGYLHLFP